MLSRLRGLDKEILILTIFATLVLLAVAVAYTPSAEPPTADSFEKVVVANYTEFDQPIVVVLSLNQFAVDIGGGSVSGEHHQSPDGISYYEFSGALLQDTVHVLSGTQVRVSVSGVASPEAQYHKQVDLGQVWGIFALLYVACGLFLWHYRH